MGTKIVKIQKGSSTGQSEPATTPAHIPPSALPKPGKSGK